MLDGTIKVEVNSGIYGEQVYTSQTIYFAKCIHGETYNLSSNTCTGSASRVLFCSSTEVNCINSTLNGLSFGNLFNSCNILNLSSTKLGGRNGWRLPTKNELKLLINCKDPSEMPSDLNLKSCSTTDGLGAINRLFPINQSYSSYWSSTTYDKDIYRAMHVSLLNGSVNTAMKQNGPTLYVRCVSD